MYKIVQTNKDDFMQYGHWDDKKYSLICKNYKIVITKNLEKQVVECFQYALCHQGETCIELSISQHFYWMNLRKTKICTKCNAIRI